MRRFSFVRHESFPPSRSICICEQRMMGGKSKCRETVLSRGSKEAILQGGWKISSNSHDSQPTVLSTPHYHSPPNCLSGPPVDCAAKLRLREFSGLSSLLCTRRQASVQGSGAGIFAGLLAVCPPQISNMGSVLKRRRNTLFSFA